jgi:hypothetical protein
MDGSSAQVAVNARVNCYEAPCHQAIQEIDKSAYRLIKEFLNVLEKRSKPRPARSGS